MACVCVPIVEAVITTAATAIVKSKEVKNSKSAVSEIRLSEKLGWLNKMLWGGSALLAFEHIWHGEITPFFPFLTAASNPADTAEMLHEMATSGVAMAVVTTAAWACICGISSIIEKNRKNAGVQTEGADS